MQLALPSAEPEFVQTYQGYDFDLAPRPGFSEVSFEKLGLRFAVRFSSDRCFSAISKYALPPDCCRLDSNAGVTRIFTLTGESDSEQDIYQVETHRRTSGETTTFEVNTLFYACLFLEAAIEEYLIKETEEYLFVHAGAVAWNGVAIVLPGDSYAGKSTLVSALLKLGARYISDEFAILDRSGSVQPFPNLLSIRDGTGYVGRRAELSEFGGYACTTPKDVGLVAFLNYSSGASWSIEEMTESESVLQLLRYSFPQAGSGGLTLDAAAAAVFGARSVIGSRGEAMPTAQKLLRLAESSAASAIQETM